MGEALGGVKGFVGRDRVGVEMDSREVSRWKRWRRQSGRGRGGGLGSGGRGLGGGGSVECGSCGGGKQEVLGEDSGAAKSETAEAAMWAAAMWVEEY